MSPGAHDVQPYRMEHQHDRRGFLTKHVLRAIERCQSNRFFLILSMCIIFWSTLAARGPRSGVPLARQ